MGKDINLVGDIVRIDYIDSVIILSARKALQSNGERTQ